MGPQNRDHSISLNKKEKKLALKCALSEKINNEEIIFIDSLELKNHKTRELSKTLNKFKFSSALFIYNEDKHIVNFKRASANIPKLNVLSEKGINVKDLILHEKIFIVKDSIKEILRRLS